MSILSWLRGVPPQETSLKPAAVLAEEAAMDAKFAELAQRKSASEQALSDVMGSNRSEVQTIVSMSKRMALVAGVNELRRRPAG